jgi:hypothetical protein
MKVSELIEQLKAFDPDLMVVVDGYEGGVDEPEPPVEILLKLNVHKDWYYGKHDAAHATDEEKPDCAAVYLCR